MSTFENIDFWLETVKKATDDNIVIYLVGNKADLIDSSGNNRRVTKEQAIQYSKYRHFQGFGECSALKNINIKETFTSFYKTLYKKNKTKLIEKTQEKLTQFENIIIDLELNCVEGKDGKLNEEKAKKIIEEKYSKYVNYSDNIINHFKDRRTTIKKSLIRKKWHKNKS